MAQQNTNNNQEQKPIIRSSNTFDFDNWIDEHKLQDIKQCFVAHNMTTLDALTTENANYIKLISDPQIIAKAHLAIHATIHTAMSALVYAKGPIFFIVWSEKEKQVLLGLEGNIDCLKAKRSELESNIQKKVQIKQRKNNLAIIDHKIKMDTQFQSLRNRIDSTFNALEIEFKTVKNTILKDLTKYDSDIAAQQMNHSRQKALIDKKSTESLQRIDKDMQYFVNVNKICAMILKNSPNKIDTSNNWKLFDAINEKRQNAILQTCQKAQVEYTKKSIILDANIDEIFKYLSTILQLPTPVYPTVNKQILARIENNMEGLMEITDKDTKQSGLALKSRSATKHRGRNAQVRQSKIESSVKLRQSKTESETFFTSSNPKYEYTPPQEDPNDYDRVVSQTDTVVKRMFFSIFLENDDR